MKDNLSIISIAKDVLHSESNSLLSAAENINENFSEIVQLIHHCSGKLIVTGIGKSAHIGNKIVATLNSTGTKAVFMHAAEAVHGDLGIISPEDIVLCISKSGNSPEIQNLIPIIKRFGNPLIGMTANDKSTLGSSCDYFINCFVEEEVCPNNLAPTNSTTVQLALGDALAVCLMKIKNFSAEHFAKYHPGGALGKNLLLKISDVINYDTPPKVSTKATINEVIYEISSKRLGATAVIEEGKVIGIITDGDLRRMLEKNLSIQATTANDVLTRKPITIEENALLSEALFILERKKITQLIVVDSNNNYKGIIHLYDILKEGVAL